jgi:hypothetical protein
MKMDAEAAGSVALSAGQVRGVVGPDVLLGKRLMERGEGLRMLEGARGVKLAEGRLGGYVRRALAEEGGKSKEKQSRKDEAAHLKGTPSQEQISQSRRYARGSGKSTGQLGESTQPAERRVF